MYMTYISQDSAPRSMSVDPKGTPASRLSTKIEIAEVSASKCEVEAEYENGDG